LTKTQNEESLKGLTFGTLTVEDKVAFKQSYNIYDILASAAILGVIIWIMISFTG
jgi:SSS family solute:Na+ symporter